LYDKSQVEQKKRSRLSGVVVGGAGLVVLVDMASNLLAMVTRVKKNEAMRHTVGNWLDLPCFEDFFEWVWMLGCGA
jgi:ubiquinone/menaquinone biosynthesis C-methylase UbiE